MKDDQIEYHNQMLQDIISDNIFELLELSKKRISDTIIFDRQIRIISASIKAAQFIADSFYNENDRTNQDIEIYLNGLDEQLLKENEEIINKEK